MEEQRLISIQQQFRAALNDLFNAADSTLKPGDLDKTFAEFGIKEKCFLMQIVKADNA